MGLIKITLFGLFSTLVALPLVAQDTTTSSGSEEVNYNKLPEEYWPMKSQVKKKNQDQLEAYINGDTLYSPRLKRQMAIGIAGGLASVSGDVKSVAGFGTSIFFRHNISYILSARYEFGFYRTWGQNYEPRSLRGDLMDPNSAYRNSAYRVNDYRAAGVNVAFDNYKTDILDLKASVILNLTNLMLMHRKQTRFNLYAHLGGGIMNYKTWVDALDDNGKIYNYNKILTEIPAFGIESERGTSISPGERSDVRKYLYDNVYNSRPRGRDYETLGEGHKNEENIFGRVSNFILSGGLGVEALVGKKDRVSIGLEHSMTLTNDDLLDGVTWSDQGDLTTNFDTYHYVSARISFFLGKKSKRAIPMWWDNPQATYLRKYEAPGDHFKDTDNDGVDDFFDVEADSKVDCPVDAKGRTLDSDGDGCPDCEDPEPFSSPLLPIVECKNVYDGFATKECCDAKAASAKPSAVFPIVAFAPDSYGINKDQLAELDQIAKMMQENPDAKVVINGISKSTKNIKYNEQLAWLRANAAVDYLVEKYGISRDRFIVQYHGETIKSEGGDFDKFQNNRVEFRFAEEGESGSSNPPAPHPGYKAGKK
jgi:outer membrane protein OmpA-like peptidoglycan-associated protein